MRQYRLLSFLICVLFLLTASAKHAVAQPASIFDDFELDGDPNSLLSDDWDVVNPLGGGATVYSGVIQDTSSPDMIFYSGSSKDFLWVSEWQWEYSTLPDADDLTNAYAAVYSGQHFYFGTDRFANNGSSEVGIWFFQDLVAPLPDGTFSGYQRPGDLLILSNLPSGGNISLVDVYQWVGDGSGSEGNLDLIASGLDCTGSGPAAVVCATVNQTSEPAAWPYEPKSGDPGVFPTGSFLEGGADVSQLLPSQPCFSTFLVETRSSHSIDAQLKDFVVGRMETCRIVASVHGPELLPPGTEAVYTIHLANSGTQWMYLESVVDDVLGDLTAHAFDAGCGALGPRYHHTDSCTFSVSYITSADDPNPLRNEVVATYNSAPDLEGDTRQAADDHVLGLFIPALTIEKTGDSLAQVGDPVTYWFKITNISSANSPPLLLDSVVDSVLGDLTAAAFAAGCGALWPGEFCEFSVERLVLPYDPDPLFNQVVVHSHPEGFPNDIVEKDFHEVELFQPAISLELGGDVYSKHGDTAHWTITAVNTSSADSPPLSCTITDPVIGLAATPFNFGPGEIFVLDTEREITEPADPDPLVNEAVLACTVDGFGNALEARAGHSIDLVHPELVVTKTCLESPVPPGAAAGFRIDVENVGDIPLEAHVSDPMLGLDQYMIIGTVGPAGCVFDADPSDGCYRVEAEVVATGEDVYNEVTVVATLPPFYNLDNVLTYTADAVCEVEPFQPGLSVTKGGTALAQVGDPVVYDFTITNTSSADTPDLVLESVADSVLGDLGPVAAAAGCGVLSPGEFCVFSVERLVLPGDPDPLTNVVTTTYYPEGFDTLVSSNDSHSVNLFQPELVLVKDGTTLSKVGDPVVYEFTVSNTSSADSPRLELISFGDDRLGDLTGYAAAAGCDVLPPGAACAFVVDYIVQPGDPDPLVNVATVHYHPAGFPNDITASDDHSLNLFQPAIGVEVVGDLYSKHGDLAHWAVTAVNTSSADSPNLTCVLSDPVIELPETHFSFGPGEIFVADVVREISEPPDVNPLVDEAFLYCTVDGFHNELEARAGHSVELVHPDFEVALACSNEPVPQEGPAEYTATISNTGDVPLEVHTFPGDWFPLGTGDSMTYPVSVDGPFVSVPLVEGEVTANAVLPTEYGLDNVLTRTATASCAVASQVSVLKTTNGVEDPSRSWVFGIWEGPDGFDGYFLAIDTTLADPDGILAFGNLGLDAAGTYTLCEDSVPAGWATFWRVDADGDGLADTTVIPDNPNADDNPPQDLGNRCIDFGGGTGIDLLTAGGTLVFEVDNAFPGGAPRSPGYWKNWNRCTNGGQADGADANGGWVEGYWLLEDVLDPNIGGGIVWDDILSDDLEFPITTCEAAVAILDARDATGGKKKANDGAYTLARALLAAQLNFGAGACTTAEVLNTALAAETLLDELDFDGTGTYLRPKSADYGSALDRASELDAYNNGLICGDTE